MIDKKNFEVIIIGGSYAGLSAAMALGRSLREVLIIDSGLPCNRQTPHAHNFITQDGEKPDVIAAKARAQVLNYKTVKFIAAVAVTGEKTENGFTITTQSGDRFTAKKLIFATGIRDTMTEIKGIEACWGISVIHCPYCHGYEFQNQKTGIMANGERAFHLASLVNNLANTISVITMGKPDFNDEQVAKLHNHNIKIIEKNVSEIEHKDGHIKNIIFSDGTRENFDAVYAALPFSQHSDIPEAMGCEYTEHGYIKIDNQQETTIKGVFACGDNSTMMRALAYAVYSGNLTGAMVNRQLTEEQF